VEDVAGGGAGSALQLRFYGPGERGTAVAVEDGVGADCVFVWGWGVSDAESRCVASFEGLNWTSRKR